MIEPVQIDADFPGGNILVDRIDGDAAHVRQDLRDTEGHWFYWCFRVRGGAGRTLRFAFDPPNVIGVHGPAISTDGGSAWTWGGAGIVDGASFRHSFGPEDHDVRFAMGVPYVMSDLQRWIDARSDDPRLKVEALCRTRAGADAPLLRIEPTAPARHSVLLTARHHACEAMANFTLEGVLDAALADPWFAQHACIAAAPLVDYDGVQAGDQGKNRRPHDHNRDYFDEGIYPETRAIRGLALGWPGGLDAHLDLHCPYIRGADCNQSVYQVGSRHPAHWARQQRFATILEGLHEGVVPYRAEDDLPFGERWNVATNEKDGGCKSTRWMAEHTPTRFVTTFEIPYADAHGVRITPDAARELGRSVAMALKRYLSDPS